MPNVTEFTVSLKDLGISTEQIEEELKIYCDCEEEVENPIYTTGTKIKGVGFVSHHGWLCPKCGKYVQVG